MSTRELYLGGAGQLELRVLYAEVVVPRVVLEEVVVADLRPQTHSPRSFAP